MTHVCIGVANDNGQFLSGVIGRLRYRNGWQNVTLPDERRFCGYHTIMSPYRETLTFYAEEQCEILSRVAIGGYGGPGFDAGFVCADGVLKRRETYEVRPELNMRCIAFWWEVALVTNVTEGTFDYISRMNLLRTLVDAVNAWPDD